MTELAAASNGVVKMLRESRGEEAEPDRRIDGCRPLIILDLKLRTPRQFLSGGKIRNSGAPGPPLGGATIPKSVTIREGRKGPGCQIVCP